MEFIYEWEMPTYIFWGEIFWFISRKNNENDRYRFVGKLNGIRYATVYCGGTKQSIATEIFGKIL